MDQLCEGSTATAGQFEWVDSLLVQAMKHGHWLVISHANFCRYTCINVLYAAIVLSQSISTGQAEPITRARRSAEH